MAKLSFFLIFIFFALMASNALASTIITVDGTGGADYTSIQEAVDNATVGDTILVYPGTYIENVNINKELTVKSYSGNPNDTIVRVANSKDNIFDVTANNVTISGFKIIGAGTAPYTAEDKAGIYVEGSNGVVISNNNISSKLFSSNSFGIFALDSSNNIIFNNSESESRVGIFLWNSSNNKLYNNVLNLNNHNGILLYGASNNNELINNTVSHSGFGLELDIFCKNNTFRDNTASKNHIGIFLLNSSNNYLINNSANSNNWNGIGLQRSSNNTLLNNIANFNNNSGIFLIYSCSNTLDSNNASKNMEYGINVNNFSRSNLLKGNAANSNGKKDIIFTEPENNTISSPAEKTPFQGSALEVTVILIISVIFRKNCLKKE